MTKTRLYKNNCVNQKLVRRTNLLFVVGLEEISIQKYFTYNNKNLNN